METKMKVEPDAVPSSAVQRPKHGFRARQCGNAPRQPKFEGRCKDLKGYVLDCSDGRQVDRYRVVMKEIAKYVERTYAHGGDIRWTIEHEEMFVIPLPPDLPDNPTDTRRRIWESKIDAYVKRKGKLEENCRIAFYLLFDQSTDYMRAKLEAMPEFTRIKADFDLLGLIRLIKGLVYRCKGQRYNFLALHAAKKRFYQFYQTRDMTNAQFLKKFQKYILVVEQYGGDIGWDPRSMRAELTAAGISDHDAATDEQKETANQAAKDKYRAVALLHAADRGRYWKLIEDLENDYTKGNNNYPTTISGAYNLLENYKNSQQ